VGWEENLVVKPLQSTVHQALNILWSTKYMGGLCLRWCAKTPNLGIL